MQRQELAKAIGHSNGMITRLLRLSTDDPPGPKTSRIAKKVADYLGVPLPSAQHEDYDMLFVKLAKMKRDNPTVHTHVINLLKAIIGTPSAPSPAPPRKETSESTNSVKPDTASQKKKR